MQEKEFNLLEEPWIRVLTMDLDEKEVSLLEVLVHAHEYSALSGEMPTQDFAVLRVLLACIQTVFYRYNADGEFDPIDEDWDTGDVLDRWREYRENGKFPENAIRSYLEEYRERFWLFHSETPFYQVADLKYGTDYGAQSLYGNVKSSNNKATKYHFSMKEGEEINSLSYPEAARWLLHVNGFGVNVKNKKEAPGTTNAAGVGRLGKLGILYIDAGTLFEILMLNMTPLNPDEELWGAPKPIWESPVHTDQSIEIAPPDNLPELYTIQSRRILLRREDGAVIGFRALNGDYYSTEDDFNEPMTLWRKSEDKKSHRVTYLPKKYKPEVQVWREFSAIFTPDKEGHLPGIVQWGNLLCSEGMALQNTLVTFHVIGMVYGDGMSYTLGDCVSDGLTLSSELLSNFEGAWMNSILDEVEKCKRVVETAIKPFAAKLGQIFNDDPKRRESLLAERTYSAIDHPFRSWLVDINPASDKKEERCAQWEQMAKRCANRVVKEYIDSLTVDRYKIRTTESGAVLSVPGAYNEYLSRLNQIYMAG